MGDVNLHSFIGPADNGRTVDMTDQVINGNGYADSIKCTSELQNFTGLFGTVLGGSEDCADINNKSKNTKLVAVTWSSGGRNVFTVKGGSEDTYLEGSIQQHGKEVDVDLGNWSDQSQDKTKRTTLNLRSYNSKPVKVRVLHSDTPKFVPGSGPYKYAFPSPKLGIFHTLCVKALFLYFKLTK